MLFSALFFGVAVICYDNHYSVLNVQCKEVLYFLLYPSFERVTIVLRIDRISLTITGWRLLWIDPAIQYGYRFRFPLESQWKTQHFLHKVTKDDWPLVRSGDFCCASFMSYHIILFLYRPEFINLFSYTVMDTDFLVRLIPFFYKPQTPCVHKSL